MATQKSELEVVVRGRDELGPELAKIESKIIRVVGAISASLAAIRISTAPIRAAAEFERALADVAKTTEFTRGELAKTKGDIDALGRSILNMSTRVDVSAVELAKIAAIAGQQGLGRFGVEGVLAFTESVARMSSVLDVTAEEAGDNIGKIINIFKVPLNEVEKAVSIFNEVSNRSTASGTDLLDVVKRIGDAAGALDLEGAAALAATGLDFGQSPEVVGTSFAKVFSALFEDAEKFSKILGTTPDVFIAKLRNDGVGAVKEVLAAFRNLDPISQQQQIVKLFGGGRIGALVNKLIQDTTNTVLERNLEAARVGAGGLSAIKEQATVLNTLSAQAVILRNSLFKLGAEGADALLAPLTQYTAQLSKALQEPGVKSFITAAVGAIGDLITTLVEAIKWVGSLNINWENFVKVIEFFLKIKIAEFLIGLISRIKIFGVSLKSISADATAAAAATQKFGAASAAATATQNAGLLGAVKNWALVSLGIKDAVEGYKKYRDAVREQKLAQDALATANQKSIDAQKARFQAQAASSEVGIQVQDSSAIVARQRQAVRDAEARAAAAAIQAQQALTNRLAEAEQLRQQRLTQIETAYQERRRAIAATGTRVGLTALQAERDRQLALTQESYERSVRSTQAYYTRRAAIQQTALQAEVARERLALMQRFGEFDALVAEQSGRQAAAVAANTASVAAGTAAAAAASRVSILTATTNAAKAAFASFTVGVRALATALVGLARIAAGAFVWVTIIFSLADALGFMDKLKAAFGRVTDAIGLTSQAQRDAKIASEIQKKEVEELTKKIEEQTKALRENQDAQGNLQPGRIAQLLKTASTSESPEDRAQAVRDLSSIQGSLDQKAVDERVKIQKEALARELEERTNALGELQAKLIERRRKVEEAIAKGLKPENLTPSQQGRFARTQQEIAQLEQDIVGAEKGIRSLESAIEKAGTKATNEKAQFGALAKEIGTLFTPESAGAFLRFGPEIDDARKKVESLTKEYTNQQQAITEGSSSAKAASIVTEQRLKEEQDRLSQVRAELTQYIDAQIRIPGVPKNVIDSLIAVKTILSDSKTDASAIVRALQQLTSAEFTGVNVPVAPPPSSGNKTFSGKSEESEARKRRRAELQLARTIIQQENELNDERNRQLLAADQRLYDQGLIAIQDFYKEKRRIQQEGLDADIADKVREIAAVNFELDKKGLTGSETVKFQTERERLLGQIRVLAERKKAIDAELTDEERKAQDAFNNRVEEEISNLFEAGLLPPNIDQIFETNFNVLLSKQKAFIDALRSQGRGAIAEALVASFNIQAFERAVTPINKEVQRIYDGLSRDQARIDIARANGALSAAEAEGVYAEQIKSVIPKLQEQIALYERRLKITLEAENLDTKAFAEQTAALDALRLKLLQLMQDTDRVAREINQSIAGELSSALQRVGIDKFKDIVNDFLLSVANSIKRLFADKLAQELLRLIGSVGGGGIGGAIQKVLTKTGPDGSTPAKALYVRTADGTLAKTADPSIGPPDPNQPVGIFDQVTAQLKTAFETIKRTLSDIFSNMGSTLLTLLQNIGSTLTSAGSSVLDFVTALFLHEGGSVATGGRQRAVDARVFRNARRYHDGVNKVSGLRANEVPAILEKAETVLTERQNETVSSALSGGGQKDMSIRNVLVTDENFVPDAMSSAAGEKVLFSFITKNKASLKRILT